MTEESSLVARLADRRMVICAGPGGVGKTTTAAAIALALASRGLKVAVVTIDPARRLADALGVGALDNEPRRVDPERFRAAGLPMAGELSAMMLDSKRTFDTLIERLAPDRAVRDEILGNKIYHELSTAVAGSQEFTAIAKLYELDAEGTYDVVVLDTPPARNALDFLDAPGRLVGFFQGRAVRLFLRPAGFGGRLLGAGTGAVFGLMKRATGVDLLEDLSVFFRSLGGLVDGFTERARHVEALLADPSTAFVIITSPDAGPVKEAAAFGRKLGQAGLAVAAVVVNRVQPGANPGAPGPDDRLRAGGEPVDDALAEALGPDLAARVARAARDFGALAARDTRGLDQLREHLGATPIVTVPRFDEDVSDVTGLVRVVTRLDQ